MIVKGASLAEQQSMEQWAHHIDADYARDSWQPGMLDPRDIVLRQSSGWGMTLTLRDVRTWLGVRIVRAFPLSQGWKYMTFLNRKNDEIGTIRSLKDLEPVTRQLAETEIRHRYLVNVIQSIHSLRCEGDTLYLGVSCQRGQRECVVKATRETVVRLDDARLIIVDVDGNRFEIDDIQRFGRRVQDTFNQVL
jgi:hypothetical protein